MAKSMRCKREKRLRAIKREIVASEPSVLKKEAAKLAAQEAALAAPKLVVKSPFTSTTMDTSTSTPNNDNSMGMFLLIYSFYCSLFAFFGIKMISFCLLCCGFLVGRANFVVIIPFHSFKCIYVIRSHGLCYLTEVSRVLTKSLNNRETLFRISTSTMEYIHCNLQVYPT